MQAQHDIAVGSHSLSYNLKSWGYSPTVLYHGIFLFSWKCLSSLKALQSTLIVTSSERDFLTNNNFEKPAVLKLGPGRGEVLEFLFVVSETFCTDVLNF